MPKTKLTVYYGYDPNRPHKAEIIVATPVTTNLAYSVAADGTNPSTAGEGAIVGRLTTFIKSIMDSSSQLFRATASYYTDDYGDGPQSVEPITGFPASATGLGSTPNAGVAGQYVGLQCRNFYGRQVRLHCKLVGATWVPYPARWSMTTSGPVAAVQLRLQLNALATYGVTRLASTVKDFVVLGSWSDTLLHGVFNG